ncbi:MAG: VF530 family DNA-binding protein [Actinomycetota bacterium]
MNTDIDYKNNPLHGVSLKQVVTELANHYGFKILYAYLNINCFNTNPSIDSSVKFLKKTDWAREKVEAFYLYQFKNLPRASAEQFELPPRDRVIPPDQKPGEPAELSLEDAERLREKRARKAAMRDQDAGYRAGSGRRGSNQSNASPYGDADPWAKWRK